MSLSPLAWSLLLGAAAAAANVIGGLVVVSRKHWNELVLKYFIALGAGFMLAATFLRMLPESLAALSPAPLLILGGYFLVHFFEHTIAPHFHFGEEVHDDVMMNPAVGFSALVGLSIHTFFDGVSIASGFLVSVPAGPARSSARSRCTRSPRGSRWRPSRSPRGAGKRGALIASFVLAAATLAGVLGMHRFAAPCPTRCPLSTGVTLYVAASDLIPEVNEERGHRAWRWSCSWASRSSTSPSWDSRAWVFDASAGTLVVCRRAVERFKAMNVAPPRAAGSSLLALPAAAAEKPQINVQEFTLGNGMRWLLFEHHESPTIAAGWLARVGSVNERPGITGISHFFEHMMFKGTHVIGTKDIEADLQDHRGAGEGPRGHARGARAHARAPAPRRDRRPDAAREPDREVPRAGEASSTRSCRSSARTIIKDQLDQIYTRNGGECLNASTSEDWTVYFVRAARRTGSSCGPGWSRTAC